MAVQCGKVAKQIVQESKDAPARACDKSRPFLNVVTKVHKFARGQAQNWTNIEGSLGILREVTQEIP